MGAIQQVLLGYGGGVAASSYDTLMTAIAADLRWKLDETSGTSAVDSGTGLHNGTLTGGATFASSGVSAAPASGFAGLGRGTNFGASSVADVRRSGQVALYGSSSSTWTLILWITGSAGSGYVMSRQNEAAVIYGFVADTVEFFSIGYSGTDPRTGSQISLPAADTTTPHMIVYRYNNGTWSGFKDGSSVFSVSRSFGLPGIVNTTYLGSDSSTAEYNGLCYEAAWKDTALTDLQIANLWAARNI